MKNGAFTWKTNAKPTTSLKKQTPRQNRIQKKQPKENNVKKMPNWCLWVCNDIGPHVLSDIDSVGRKLSSLFGRERWCVL